MISGGGLASTLQRRVTTLPGSDDWLLGADTKSGASEGKKDAEHELLWPRNERKHLIINGETGETGMQGLFLPGERIEWNNFFFIYNGKINVVVTVDTAKKQKGK